jgi:hypothetical protein
MINTAVQKEILEKYRSGKILDPKDEVSVGQLCRMAEMHVGFTHIVDVEKGTITPQPIAKTTPRGVTDVESFDL